MISIDTKEGTLVKVKKYEGTAKFVRWFDANLAIIHFDGDRLYGEFVVNKKQLELYDMSTKYVFNIFSGKDLSIALPFENYPVPEKYGFRLWTNKVHPCYDINNRYMGYIDNGKFYDMRNGWYCNVCNYETEAGWKALIHKVKHLHSMTYRKADKIEINNEYCNEKVYLNEGDYYW